IVDAGGAEREHHRRRPGVEESPKILGHPFALIAAIEEWKAGDNRIGRPIGLRPGERPRKEGEVEPRRPLAVEERVGMAARQAQLRPQPKNLRAPWSYHAFRESEQHAEDPRPEPAPVRQLRP